MLIGQLTCFARPVASLPSSYESRPGAQPPAYDPADTVSLRQLAQATAPSFKGGLAVEAFCWTPDGKVLSTESPSLVGTPARIRLWSPQGNEEPVDFDVHRTNVRIGPVAASTDGELVAVGWDDGKFSVFSGHGAELNYQEHCPTSVPNEQGILRDIDDVRAVAFSPDNRTLATAGQDGRLVLWDAQGRESRGTLIHPDRVTDIAFTPDSSRLVTRFRGGLAVWDANEQRLIHRIEDTRKDHASGGMALSSDGKKLAAVVERQVKVFDVATGEELHSQFVSGARKVAFTPDGNHVLVGEALANAVHDWNLTTGECHREVLPHVGGPADAQGIRQMSLSRDGKQLAIGLMDHTLTLWRQEEHNDDLGFLAGEQRAPGTRVANYLCTGRVQPSNRK